jgi:hypothetical protein
MKAVMAMQERDAMCHVRTSLAPDDELVLRPFLGRLAEGRGEGRRRGTWFGAEKIPLRLEAAKIRTL